MRSLLRPARLALAWASCLAIIWLSLMDKPPQGPELPMSDKVGHLAAYGLLMLQFGLLYRGKPAMAYAAGFIGMGAGLECLQHFTASRSFEFADMAANVAGVALGFWSCKYFDRE